MPRPARLKEKSGSATTKVKHSAVMSDLTNRSLRNRDKKDEKSTKRKSDSEAENPENDKKRASEENGVKGTTSDAEADKPRSSKSDEGSNDGSEYVELFRKIGKTIGSSYIDIGSRLKLDTIPYCVANTEFCATNHSKKCERPDPVDKRHVSATKILSRNSRYFNSIKFIEDYCIRGLFPGEELMHHLLRMILTASNPMESKTIIEESSMVFLNIVKKFPPCWYDLQDSYRKMFLNKFEVPGTKLRSLPIIEFILSTLEHLMRQEDEPVQSESSDEESYMSYDTFEKKNTFNPTFDTHSRNDKFERIFIVLDLLIKVFEYDLSIWIRRHLRTTYEKMFDDKKKPIIACVFFDGSINNLTSLVKSTLSVFINAVCFSYPQDKMDILARLVSLLSHATYLCERNPVDNGVSYPHTANQCDIFTKEIFKVIEANIGRNLRCIFAVADNIKAPFIKYSLISNVLNMLNNTKGSFTIQKVFDDFNRQRWLLECREDEAPVFKSPKKICLLPSSDKKYPIVTTKVLKKPKADEIYSKEYLKILLSALQAYCDIYDIKQIAEVFLGNKKTCKSPETSTTSKKKEDALDLFKIQKDIKKLEKRIKLDEKRATRIKYFSFDGIFVDQEVVIRYRNDLKFFMILKKLINQLWETHGAIFDEWHEYVNEMIPG